MNTYLLFINGFFENPKEIDNFSQEFMDGLKNVESPKFVIENQYNMIIIFNTEEDEDKISELIKKVITQSYINFFFLFNREDIMVANIPQEISSIIFKDLPKDSSLQVNWEKNIEEISDEEKEKLIDDSEPENELYVDALLEKINKFGIESLTEKEKKFLDNFKN